MKKTDGRKNNGGHKGCGRKQIYGEETTNKTVRMPISKVKEIRKRIKDEILKDYLVDGNL